MSGAELSSAESAAPKCPFPPPNTVDREENTANIAIELVKSKQGPNINITPNDISVAHWLQAKPTTQGSPWPPNIYVKLTVHFLFIDGTILFPITFYYSSITILFQDVTVISS